MNREAMETWIAALEHPANEKRKIRHLYSDGVGGVCVLGLAREALHASWLGGLIATLGTINCLYVNVAEEEVYVAELNDAGWSFWDIAQALRATHLKETT